MVSYAIKVRVLEANVYAWVCVGPRLPWRGFNWLEMDAFVYLAPMFSALLVWLFG
jgi:hypothetical protein